MSSGTGPQLQTSIPSADGDLLQQSSLPPGERNNETCHPSFGDTSMSTVSPEGLGTSHTYDGIDAELDHGFNMAFGALERGE
jgi:hypothetical protein